MPSSNAYPPQADDASLFAGAGPRLYSIPAGRPFLDDLARGLVGAVGRDPLALAEAEVLLPTRRAARAFSEAVLAASGETASLAPRVRAIGDLDTEGVATASDLGAFKAALSLPPAATDADRRLTLARLIHARDRARGEASWTAALAGADALSAFFESVETEDVDLTLLADVFPEQYAAHWEDALAFLKIAAEAWPAHLAEQELLDPARRRRLAVEAYAEELEFAPPERPIILAGSTGSMPAVARLMLAVARAPRGCVVLPGVDLDLDEAAWSQVDERHLQGGLRALLNRPGFGGREAVRPWPASPSGDELTPRRALLSAALRPADATETLREAADALAPKAAEAVGGISILAAEDETNEALAVALMVREALETPERRVLVVTPDRGLARRISSALRRWGVDADDSAGREAYRSTAGAYLERAAALVADPSDPVAFLSFCRHPLARFSLPADRVGAAVARLDRNLRDHRRQETPEEMRKRAAGEKPPDDVAAVIGAVRAALPESIGGAAGEALDAHLAFAERLAATETLDGPTALWSAHGGAAIALALAEARPALAEMAAFEAREYGQFFRRLLAGLAIRPRSAEHPRVLILGPLEARLQTADLVILSGLVEGVWPKAAAEDPFLSRPMRKELGLPSPERRIGLAAHDFAQLASAPEVRLTYAKRAGGKPARPSRFIIRLENLIGSDALKAARPAAPLHGRWAAALDRCARPDRARAPAPRPPLEARPRALSASDLATLARDPYAIYAKKVLRLKPLDPVDMEIDARLRGTVIHTALEDFGRAAQAGAAPDAARLLEFFEDALTENRVPDDLRALWRPRLEKALRWLAENDRAFLEGRIALLEEKGEIVYADLPGGPFTAHAKADRIDRAQSGAFIIWDYKTGRAATAPEMKAGLAPQLPLEALILESGGYEALGAGRVEAVGYIRLTGAGEGGEDKRVEGGKWEEVLQAAREGLPSLLAQYDDPQTPYLSQPRARVRTDFGDYDRLARRPEWSRGEEDEG